ncbi:hypothetical protein C0585_03115 [Candidatus Woesearchaeota archaeon]|nr:MAG: hypothetical protein C0585_03115 [Candidatus Woesearchaeota archaeon]
MDRRTFLKNLGLATASLTMPKTALASLEDTIKYLDGTRERKIGNTLKVQKAYELSNEKGLSLLVDKTNYSLQVLSKGKVIHEYPIELGFDPKNDKEVEGDGRTPEGHFFICKKNPYSNFHKSLGISYPNLEDVERGLHEGLITQKEADSIEYQIKNEMQPLWKTALGGEVMIHGSGSGKTPNQGGRNWTWGCISLADNHIDEVYDISKVGTPLIIVKNNPYLR